MFHVINWIPTKVSNLPFLLGASHADVKKKKKKKKKKKTSVILSSLRGWCEKALWNDPFSWPITTKIREPVEARQQVELSAKVSGEFFLLFMFWLIGAWLYFFFFSISLPSFSFAYHYFHSSLPLFRALIVDWNVDCSKTKLETENQTRARTHTHTHAQRKKRRNFVVKQFVDKKVICAYHKLYTHN